MLGVRLLQINPLTTYMISERRIRMNKVLPAKQMVEVGEDFLMALQARDFDQLEACFQPDIHFRALVPPGIREGTDAHETVSWLKRWFDDADEFQTLMSSVHEVADRLHITYRFRLRKGIDWKVIEQQAYCVVSDDRIQVMNLLCSGFRPDPDYQRRID